MSEQPLSHEQALAFMRFARLGEVELRDFTRNGRHYCFYAKTHGGKKIITCAKLKRLSVAEFAEYLNGFVGWKVFPDPNVYR